MRRVQKSSAMGSPWASSFFGLVIAALAIMSNGCGSGSESTPQADGNTQAAGAAPSIITQSTAPSRPLAGLTGSQSFTSVTDAELEELRKDHTLVPANQPVKDRRTQMEENLAAAAGYLQNHPDAAKRLAPAIQHARAGAAPVLHQTTVRNRDGHDKPVLLMDEDWQLNSALKWMAVVEMKSNQLTLFKILKHKYPDGYLPDRTLLPTEDQAAAMPAQELVGWNSRLAPEGELSDSGTERPQSAATPESLPAPSLGAALGHPNQEYGVSWGTDLEALGVNIAQAPRSPYGLMRFAPQFFPHWGPNTPNFSNVTSVKDQQWVRGTCTAFATASAMEAAALASFSIPTNLSEQALYGFGLLGNTSGSDGYQSGDYLDAMGNGSYAAVPYESSWDYNSALARYAPYVTSPPFASSCDGYGKGCSDTIGEDPLVCTSSQCAYEYPVAANTSGVTVTSSSGIGLSTAVSLLQLGYPVILEFTVTPDFEDPSVFGYVNYTGNSNGEGGHAVHAVGYLNNAQVMLGALSVGNTLVGSAITPLAAGGGYFIIKNSWGDSFGDGGYVYVPYSYFQQNLTAAYSINSVAFVGSIPVIPAGIASEVPTISLPAPSVALPNGHPGSFVISNVGTIAAQVTINPQNTAQLGLTTGPSEFSHIFVLTPGTSYSQGVSPWANMTPGSYSTSVAVSAQEYPYNYNFSESESVSFTVPKPTPTPPGFPCVNPHVGCKP